MTSSQLHSPDTSWRDRYREHGYYFREAAMLTIAMGFAMHIYRVIFGDAATLQHVWTPTADKILLVPMTYAAVTGILVWRRVDFANTPHKALFTWSLVYIAGSVPLHFYFAVIKGNVDFYFSFFPVWFSYLLFPFYTALLIMFSRLRFKK
jgi:hypothetical protein